VRPGLLVPLAVLLAAALSACAHGSSDTRNAASDSVTPPRLGACRVLTPDDIAQPSNDSPAVDCATGHTAETFAVGSFPAGITTGSVDDPSLGAYVYHECQHRFQRFLGGDESLVMRTTLTWAWFRPSEAAWKKGAHWWRCDVVGGGEQSTKFVELPTTAKGVLLGKPDDRWMICVNGPTVSGSVKSPCSEKHTWRAVTTIVLGKAKDPYPGDRLVEVRTRDFCSNSVGAWLNYPVDYDYGYTWFHDAEWTAGNRRSICWAKTGQ
jgi:Septum formation